MTISEKVAYLKGLAEGLGLDSEATKEGKIISVMIGILEEIGLTLEEMDENLIAVEEELDAISDDLAEVEDILFDEEDEDDDLDEDDFFETDCPNCNEVLVIDESILMAGSIECPACGEKFSIDFSDCGCGDDCTCGDDESDSCGCGCH